MSGNMTANDAMRAKQNAAMGVTTAAPNAGMLGASVASNSQSIFACIQDMNDALHVYAGLIEELESRLVAVKEGYTTPKNGVNDKQPIAAAGIQSIGPSLGNLNNRLAMLLTAI